jgi:hypothetical protein
MRIPGLEALFGPGRTPALEAGAALAARDWHGVLDAIEARAAPPPEDEDSPVFIFGAGWRCGSTLLQRMFLGGHQVMVWGEPYAHAGLVENLMQQLRPLGAAYPPASYFLDQAEGPLHEGWTANLYPGIDDLRAAHRAFFESLFAAPARARGWPRWGFKEIRLGSRHARYLRWLYPKARFLLLYRDPYDAYRSYRRWRDWYWRWPSEPVSTPLAFGRLWHRQMSDFLAWHERLDARLIPYDRLTGEDTARAVAACTAAEVVPSHLLTRQSGTTPNAIPPLPRLERFLLARKVEPLAAELASNPVARIEPADDRRRPGTVAAASGRPAMTAAPLRNS